MKSEAQKRALRKYDKEHYTNATVKLKKTQKQILEEYASCANMTVSSYIKSLIYDALNDEDKIEFKK